MFRKLFLLFFIVTAVPTYTKFFLSFNNCIDLIDSAVVKELEEKTDAIVDNLVELIKIFSSHPEIGSFIKKANALVDGIKEISEIDNYEREKAQALASKKIRMLLLGKIYREHEKGGFQNFDNTDEDERRKIFENVKSFAVFTQKHFDLSLSQSTKDN